MFSIKCFLCWLQVENGGHQWRVIVTKIWNTRIPAWKLEFTWIRNSLNYDLSLWLVELKYCFGFLNCVSLFWLVNNGRKYCFLFWFTPKLIWIFWKSITDHKYIFVSNLIFLFLQETRFSYKIIGITLVLYILVTIAYPSYFKLDPIGK